MNTEHQLLLISAETIPHAVQNKIRRAELWEMHAEPVNVFYSSQSSSEEPAGPLSPVINHSLLRYVGHNSPEVKFLVCPEEELIRARLRCINHKS